MREREREIVNLSIKQTKESPPSFKAASLARTPRSLD